jgi:hypothetical protein
VAEGAAVKALLGDGGKCVDSFSADAVVSSTCRQLSTLFNWFQLCW